MERGQHLPGEFELIARYFAPLAKGFPGAFGLTDDAAVIAPEHGHELVAKTDAIVGGVHFLADEPPDLIARKALRVNLSDLAAKGAVARAYMLDLMLPRALDEAWVCGFAHGLAEDQKEYGIHLIGGDTDMTPGPVTIAIMAFGEIAVGRMIQRGGARAGDTIFVTGTIGDAALGLAVLRGALPELDPTSVAFLAGRYQVPLPRVTVGPRLVGLATAALDVSDGLAADLGHICEVSALAAILQAPSIPLSAAARAALLAQPGLLASVLTGGDDYEILFTADPASEAEIARLAQAVGVPITAIGTMVAASSAAEHRVSVLDATGRHVVFDHEGWTHF